MGIISKLLKSGAKQAVKTNKVQKDYAKSLGAVPTKMATEKKGKTAALISKTRKESVTEGAKLVNKLEKSGVKLAKTNNVKTTTQALRIKLEKEIKMYKAVLTKQNGKMSKKDARERLATAQAKLSKLP